MGISSGLDSLQDTSGLRSAAAAPHLFWPCGEKEKRKAVGALTQLKTHKDTVNGLSEADCAAGDIDWNAAGREIQRQKEGDVGFKVLPDQLGLM